jgi:hypothetical protein
MRIARRKAVIGAAGLLSLVGLGAVIAAQTDEDPGATTVAGPAPTATRPSEEVNQRVAAIRSAAAKKGPGVLRPLPSASAPGEVTTTTSEQDGGTLKVVSARGDLTGYRELGWVAEPGSKVGAARCSDTIRLSVDAKPVKHPTLLICWRTSARKSVYTLAVKAKGKPSPKDSAAAIDRQWQRLG